MKNKQKKNPNQTFEKAINEKMEFLKLQKKFKEEIPNITKNFTKMKTEEIPNITKMKKDEMQNITKNFTKMKKENPNKNFKTSKKKEILINKEDSKREIKKSNRIKETEKRKILKKFLKNQKTFKHLSEEKIKKNHLKNLKKKIKCKSINFFERTKLDKKNKSVLITNDSFYYKKDNFIKFWKYLEKKNFEKKNFNIKLKNLFLKIGIIDLKKDFKLLKIQKLDFNGFLKELVKFKVIKNNINWKKKTLIKKIFINIKQCCSNNVCKLDFFIFLLFIFDKKFSKDFLKKIYFDKIENFDFYEIKEMIRKKKKIDVNFLRKNILFKKDLYLKNQNIENNFLHINILKNFRTSLILENSDRKKRRNLRNFKTNKILKDEKY